MRTQATWLFLTLAVLCLALSSGCQSAVTPAQGSENQADEMPALSPMTLAQGEKLQVVASTSIVADVVRNVGGDLIDLTTLMPLGADPHAFEPTPQDAAAVADAHVVFINGAGLELFLESLLQSAGAAEKVVSVSQGIELRRLDDAHEHGDADPHVWFDPHNVVVWTRNIERALSALDPDHARAYAANSAAYQAQLRELDVWIQEQVAQVPAANRELLTDHTTFGYFAARYGFEQVGAVFPGLSTLAQPSARELAALSDAIRACDVKALFVGTTVNPRLARQVAEDTGTRLVFLYTGSLSEPGGPAADYLSLMRYDVSAIVDALKT